MADKTNVMRILERAGVAHQVHLYPTDGALDAVSVAGMLGQTPDAVFKTLVTQGKSRAFYVFVIPGPQTLDLRRAAAACGEKSVEMLPQKLLLPTTGYIHGGCSPIGMKKPFPTYCDETCVLFDTIIFSGGRIGTQIEMSFDDLCQLMDVEPVDLVVD